MKMRVERNRILILPEDEEDEAYIEDTLGLKEKDEVVMCKRVACANLSRTIAYLEIRRGEGKE